MSETISRGSMMTSPPLVMMMLVGMALLIAALVMWSWRGAGWVRFVWLAVSVALVAIRTPIWYATTPIRSSSTPCTSSPFPHLRREDSLLGRADRLELWMFTGVWLAGLVLPLIHLTTGLFAPADYLLPDWATATGGALQVPVLWLFWRSHADLGRNWSVPLNSPRATASSRPASTPSSAIQCTPDGGIGMSQPLLIHNWIAGFLAIPAFVALCIVRIPLEEAMLREHFGAAFTTPMPPAPGGSSPESNANRVRPEWRFLKP